MVAPIAYQIEGEEYLAIAAGWGGANLVLADDSIAARKYPNDGKVIVLKLGGSDMPNRKRRGMSRRHVAGISTFNWAGSNSRQADL